MYQNSVWKEVVGAAVLVAFALYGIAHVIYPDRFMRPWHRGGEMLTGWNRLGIQIAGAIFAGFGNLRSLQHLPTLNR